MSDSMSARELIAGIIGPHAWGAIYPENRLKAADAILAAMPEIVRGMVVPLVWRDSYGVWRAETPFGDYKVCGRILSLPLPMNPQQVHADEDAAKAAANAHHEAQIMAGLGIKV